MSTILASHGEAVLCDQADFELLSAYSWSINAQGYPQTHVPGSGKTGAPVLMQNVLGYSFADHIDRNRLNYHRDNLRESDHTRNSWNAGPRSTATSQYKGICASGRPNQPWLMGIKLPDGSSIKKRYVDEVEAARAYDALALEHFGEYAYLNFPEARNA